MSDQFAARKRVPTSVRLRESVRLSTQGMTFMPPSNIEAEQHAVTKDGEDSWRYKLLKILHSSKVQYTFMALLLLDVIMLFVEMYLLVSYPSCSSVVPEAINCCPIVHDGSTAVAEDTHDLRFLAVKAHEGFCPSGSEESFEFEPGCDEYKYSTVHTAEQVIFILTICILSLFFLELNLSMICLRPNVFFRQFFFLLDYVIISVGLALELTFHYLHDAPKQALAGLLVMVRVWRFLRIGHGLVEITHELAEKEFEELLGYTEELEEALKEAGIQVSFTESVRKLKHCNMSTIDDIAKHHRSKVHHLQIEEGPQKDGDEDNKNIPEDEKS